MPTPTPQPSPLHAEAAAWMARMHGAAPGEEARAGLERWLAADPAHRQAFAQAEALWAELGGLETMAGRELAEARAHTGLHPRRSRLGGLSLVAAALGLLVAAGWWLDPLASLDDRTYRTGRGERAAFALADGSRLDLDTGSEATVHYSRRTRQVRLARGQAAFTVAHGDARPFDVLAGPARVRDVATQFTVRFDPARTTVAVLDGEADARPRPDAPDVRLRRGQRLVLSAQGEASPVEPVDLEVAGAWRHGQLVFSGQPLGEVLAELGRYHGAAISVSAPSILATRVTGAIPTDDLALALRTVAATLPVQASQVGPDAWRLDPR